jgi:thioester reductase-like protein
VALKKNNLVRKIHQLKTPSAPEEEQAANRSLIEAAYREYRKKVEQDPVWKVNLKEEKHYNHILLTGATGYLGAHLVVELLNHTQSRLYLPVRARTVSEAEARLKKKFSFYFNKNIQRQHRQRIEVLPGDLSREFFGLSHGQWETLVHQVEMVLHTAANVKHYGHYRDFHRDNVTATRQLLSFAVSGRVKDFHHISTISVGTNNSSTNHTPLFTEYCRVNDRNPDHVYLRSKSDAERQVMSYRQRGLHASIHRVGNLAAHSQTGRFQENIEDNAFYSTLKAYILLKIMPDDRGLRDMVFIDYAARALRLLTTRKYLVNQITHLENPCRIPPGKLAQYLNKAGIELELQKRDAFIDLLIHHLDDPDKRIIIDRFLLHSGMFNRTNNGKPFISTCERTQQILRQLDFQWPEVNETYIKKMIRHCRYVGFIRSSPPFLSVAPSYRSVERGK